MSLEQLIANESERRTRPVKLIENASVVVGGIAVPVAVGGLLIAGLLAPVPAAVIAGGSFAIAGLIKYIGSDWRAAYRAGSRSAIKDYYSSGPVRLK